MNHSMHNADSRTHVKVVALGFICALAVAAVGTYGHIGTTDGGSVPLVKASRTISVSGDTLVIR